MWFIQKPPATKPYTGNTHKSPGGAYLERTTKIRRAQHKSTNMRGRKTKKCLNRKYSILTTQIHIQNRIN